MISVAKIIAGDQNDSSVIQQSSLRGSQRTTWQSFWLLATTLIIIFVGLSTTVDAEDHSFNKPTYFQHDTDNSASPVNHDSYLDKLAHNTSLSLSTSFPLQHIKDNSNKAVSKDLVYNFASGLGIKYNENNFFIGIDFTKFLYKQPWNPDFSYSFGYDDWHPNTFNIQYANYSNNRLRPTRGEKFTKFENGSFSGGYKFIYPNLFTKGDIKDSKLKGSVGLSVTPKYYNSATAKNKNFKYVTNIGMSYEALPQLTLSLTGFTYLNKKSQEVFNPDFSYSISYKRPVKYGVFSISYQNYGPTRYPWRKKMSNFLAVKQGSIGIGWSSDIYSLFADPQK